VFDSNIQLSLTREQSFLHHTHFIRFFHFSSIISMGSKNQDNNQTIPNISLQLAFCFLPLGELAVVSLCCKKWYNAVTANAFFDIYRGGEQFFNFYQVKLPSFCSSPFRQTLRFLSFSFTLEKSPLLVLNLISWLTRLNSLELDFRLYLENTLSAFNCSPLFSMFPRSLRKMKICTTQIAQLSDGLSYLTQINELHMEETFPISNYSFLSSLINLEIISINSYLSFEHSSSDSIITAIRLLPKLTHFYSKTPLRSSGFLKKLCAQPGAPPLLMHLPEIQNVKIEDQAECAHLLHQLPALKHISYDNFNNSDIPNNTLSHFIKHLNICGREMSDRDIDAIISMHQLVDLSIQRCILTEQLFERLLSSRIGNQLTHLSFNRSIMNTKFLHSTLEKHCSQLDTLSVDMNQIIAFSSVR
jgi:hypothetical protein